MRRLAILFAATLLSMFGAAACGGGVEEQVEQQVGDQVQEAKEASRGWNRKRRRSKSR